MQYIGVKIVHATGATAGQYATMTGRLLPEDKDPSAPGYLVTYEDGYESWCPKDVFERHNRPTDAMPFSHAIEAVRQGNRIARHGWNGKGEVTFIAGRDIRPQHPPYFIIHTDLYHIENWLPDEADLLGDDWFIAT